MINSSSIHPPSSILHPRVILVMRQPEPCPPNVSKSTSETGFGLFWLWVSRKRAKDAKRPRYHCAISPVGLDLGRFELPTYRNFIVKLAVHVTTTRSRDHLANNEFLSRALGHASTIPPRCPHGAALSCGSCAPRGTPADRERLLSPRSVAISHSLIPSRLTPLSYTPLSLSTPHRHLSRRVPQGILYHRGG